MPNAKTINPPPITPNPAANSPPIIPTKPPIINATPLTNKEKTIATIDTANAKMVAIKPTKIPNAPITSPIHNGLVKTAIMINNTIVVVSIFFFSV